MGKIFFTLILYVFVLSAHLHAQELTVKSFAENVNDLSARTHPRSDLNGDVCALVKVQLAAQGASFEGNVVGNADYSTSEYSVYMTQGSKKLTVKLEGYLPLTIVFDEYKIPALVSKTTYVLTITGVQTNDQPQEVRTKTGWIILDSEPQGASVYINGEYVGNTPLDSYKQPYGSYEYKLEKPNYHNAAGSIDLNSAQFEKSVKLSPAFGSISVTSNISGAGVLLDGKSTGVFTPCTLTEIPSGSHTISLSKDRYAPRQYSITVEDGKVAKVDGSLDARFASVTVKSLEGADIFIDGSRKGSGSCMLDLMEGYYDIETTLSHHRKAIRQIQVVAGQPQTIMLTPTPIYGSLDIISTPRKANITIDGKQYGQTPYTVEQLLEGSHSVTLSLEGYASETRTVTISDGQTATVSVALQNGRQITISTKESGATIFIDGKEMGASPYTGTITFGNHTTYAILDGKKTPEQTIVSSEGTGTLPSVTLSFFVNKTFTVNGVTFTMVAVEGGTFTMGATSELQEAGLNERPIHNVTLSSYMIGETEVTQELWQAVMGHKPTSGGDQWSSSYGLGAQYPAYYISWNDVQEFITKLNSITGETFRMPTEAEWEYASRGGNKSKGDLYSGSNTIGDVAWYNGTSGTHPVKTKSPNELGLYDMSGNVYEWCPDWYDSYSRSAQTDPTGPSSGSYRVSRGGSWLSSATYCRVAYRSCLTPSNRNNHVGFRLAL